MLHSKMGLEMRMRDALDGMEQLASMYAYGRLPVEMEVLAADAIPVSNDQPSPPRLKAQILQFPSMRPSNNHRSEQSTEKYNKITML
ncbi:MAG: hypothetical protein OEX12_03165 [Gammaproteobacteria bacterium]|nr:hypothetical protein [Gammaproteobacteria bacterium]